MKNLPSIPGSEAAVLVSARQFEESPFVQRTDSPGTVRGVCSGRFFAADAGEDVIEKYWLLRRKALLFDVARKPLEITGPDAVGFLEKVFARKIASMQPGRGYYAIACTPKGGIFMDGMIFRLGANRFWYVQADGAFETWLIAHSGGFNVSISDPHSRVLQIQGPASIDIMKAASDGAITEELGYQGAGFYTVGEQKLYVSRTGTTGELGVEIYCEAATTDHLALWDHLIQTGAHFGLEFSSTRAMTIRRIEAGFLANRIDMDITMTPYEAGLGSFVDLDKGDFIGRDALIDEDQRSLLAGLICRSGTMVPGGVIMDGDRSVGTVTAGVTSPTLGCGIGYGRFKEPADRTGGNLSLKLPNGTQFPLDIVEIPFVDPEQKIVRGVDRSIPSV